jgi:hypothetical protein
VEFILHDYLPIRSYTEEISVIKLRYTSTQKFRLGCRAYGLSALSPLASSLCGVLGLSYPKALTRLSPKLLPARMMPEMLLDELGRWIACDLTTFLGHYPSVGAIARTRKDGVVGQRLHTAKATISPKAIQRSALSDCFPLELSSRRYAYPICR